MKKQLNNLVKKHDELIVQVDDLSHLKHYIRNHVSSIMLFADMYLKTDMFEKTEEEDNKLKGRILHNYNLLEIIESKLGDDLFLGLIKAGYNSGIIGVNEIFIFLGIIDEKTLQINPYYEKNINTKNL